MNSEAETFELPAKEGVILRKFTLADAEAQFELIQKNRDHLSKWGDYTSKNYPTLDATRERIRNPPNPSKLRFGVWHGGTLVGTVNLTPISEMRAEIGYWIGREFCRRGFAKIATGRIVWHAFHILDYGEVIARVRKENIASQKVLKKTGFAENGIDGDYILFIKVSEIELQRRMKLGDKLKCGCEVIRPAWIRDDAKTKVYEALAESLDRPLEEVKTTPENMVIRSLDIDTKGLRKFWSKFFVACEVDFKTAEDGTLEYAVDDSKLPMIPATIGKFIDEVANLHKNPTFQSCVYHWP